ncbi:hypothetical protein [Zavarzinella formosa]|uniref:hypothetical protein n=1 Tax=Zavarzinella formosa TaxID=360055 RepID=UPI0012FB558A|nr:hypothetical protein [Zavarzinella formosa]
MAQPRPEAESVQLDPKYENFEFIEDDAPFEYRGKKIIDPKKEMAAANELKAYDYVLAFASKLKPEVMARHSARNVPYPTLFKDGLRAEYLRELMHFEGKLSLILPMKPTDGLRELDKIDKLYEVWIYPAGHNDPLCLVVSELPEGVEPGENQNLNVSFDGYFFKLFRYESRQDKPGEAGKKQWRRAPLFLGRTFENKGSAANTEPLYSDNMLLTIVLCMLTLVLCIAGLGWWLKRGGRYVEEEKRRRLEESTSFSDESS